MLRAQIILYSFCLGEPGARLGTQLVQEAHNGALRVQRLDVQLGWSRDAQVTEAVANLPTVDKVSREEVDHYEEDYY